MTQQSYKTAKIGKITEGWTVARLGDESIADLIMGQSPPSSTYNDKGIGLPFLQGNAEFGDTYPTPILSCSQPIKIAEKNDILLSVRAPVGDVNITPFKSCIGRGLAAIRPKSDKLNYLFLYYYLKFGSRKFESLSMGSTFKAIRKEEVENFQIPLPPLPEQHRIAEVLGTIDEAIQRVSQAIAKTERLKKGLMQRLLTRGIGHERFKFSEELGCEVPEEWGVVRLGEILDLISGQYFKFSEFSNEGVRCLKIDNVGFGKVAWDTIAYLPENYLKEYSDIVLTEGDIVIALNRPIINGKVKVGMLTRNDLPSILYQRVGRMVFRDVYKLDKSYLFHFLTGDYFKEQLTRSLIGTDQPYIRTPVFLKINLPLPPLPEQQKIAEVLSTVDRKLELERRRREKLARVKKGLMSELLTGRKRVKVS